MLWWRSDSFEQIVPPTPRPCLPPLYPSHSLAHTFPSWLPVSSPRSREWPFDGCTPAFLLSSTLCLFLQKQHVQVSPAPSSLLKDENKETGVGEGRSKNWQKTLKENEFDRFVQFWNPVFLFPKSVRKAKTLPPRWLKSLRPLSAKRGDTHCFSPNYQRKVHTGRTETHIIISKLLVGNQINAGGFQMEGKKRKNKKNQKPKNRMSPE